MTASDGKSWSPDPDAALKALIRQTIEDAGDLKPDALPHRIRERLKGRVTGDIDLDAYIRAVMEDIKKERRR